MEIKRDAMTIILQTVGRAGYDRAFREEFLADPRAAFAREGVPVPDDMKINLIMEDPGVLNILVPVFDDQPVHLPADHPLLTDA